MRWSWSPAARSAVGCVLAAGALTTLGCVGKIRVVNVSGTGGISSAPIIRMQPTGSEGHLYIAWLEQPTVGTPQARFRKVHATTSPMDAPIVLGDADPLLGNLDMTVDGSHVYTAWQYWPPGSPNSWEVFLAVSTNAGGTFAPAVNLSQSSTAHSYTPKVAARGAIVYVAWAEQTSTNGRYEVRVRHSSDGGQTFAAPDVLTGFAPNQPPQVAIAGQEAFVEYCDSGVTVVRRRSLAGGAWSAPERLTATTATAVCGREALATSGTSIFAVAVERQSGVERLYVKHSTGGGPFVDAGEAWSNLGPVERVRADAIGDRVYIGFIAVTDETYGHETAYFTRTETPTTLVTPTDISGILDPVGLQLSAGGDYSGLVWSANDASNNVIMFSQTRYVGAASPGHRLRDANDVEMRGILPDVQARGGDYYVVWRAPNNEVMLYSRRAWRWKG